MQQPPPFDGSTILIDASLPVTVTVYLNGQPEPGVLVAYEDAGGAMLGTAKTDAKGTASKTLPAGSQVTVLMGGPGVTPLALYTYVGVEPGDALAVIDPATYNTYVTATITTLPPKPPSGTIDFLGYIGSCATAPFGQPPAVVSASSECLGANRFPLLVLAQAQVGPSLGYAFSKDNLPDMDAGSAQLALSGNWSTQVGAWAIGATNVPANAMAVEATFGEVANKVSYAATQAPPASFETHPGYPDFVQSEVHATFAVQNTFDLAATAIATRAPAPALGGNISFDLGQMLPILTSATSDFTSTPGRPSVSWKAAGPLAAADGTIVHLEWLQITAGLQTPFSWDLVVPPSASSVQVPSLPQASPWTPGNQVAVSSPTVATIEGLGGYARLRDVAVRPSPHVTTSPPPVVPPLPKDGTVRVTVYGPNPG